MTKLQGNLLNNWLHVTSGMKKEEVQNLRKTNLATLLTEIECCSKLYSFLAKRLANIVVYTK